MIDFISNANLILMIIGVFLYMLARDLIIKEKV